MLIFDSRAVGNKLLAIRKRMGLTQMRSMVSMRMLTVPRSMSA